LKLDNIPICPLCYSGVEKGALHHLNVDINDPKSMERVMEQIKKLSVEDPNSKKDEL